MNGSVNRDSFNLQKVKLLKGGGVESTTKIIAQIDGSTMEIERNQKTPVVPHPDLENAIRSLKEKLLISTNFLTMRTIVNSFEFKPRKDQREAVDKAIDILMNKTTVTGIHVSGQDQNRGVIISGKMQCENGSNSAVNSPRMRFTSEVFGFEEELEGEIDHIEDELYLYLHENKKAQLEVFQEE
jgi:hypothetical protein